MIKSTRITLFAIAIGLVASTAWSNSVTLSANKDNSMFQNNPDFSNGGGAGVFSGTNGQGSPRRGLLAFDIAAGVPAGATITGAQLTLTLGNAPNNNGQTIDLYRVTADWGEGTAGNSVPGIGGTGQGFAAGPGDATWNSRMNGSNLWTTPGGDFVAAASGNTIVNGPVETSFTWLSTPGMVSDVQSWLDNPSTNFGWELINEGEATNQSMKAFYSRSAAQNSTGGTLDPALRPKLFVEYAVPEPTAGLLVVLPSTLVLILRRRLK